MLQGRQAEFLLDPGQQQPAGRAQQFSNETYPGYRNPDNFIVVSDAYPTVTAMAADLILPAAMWVEKEGAYGNAERRTHVWRQLVNAPGEARSDLWQMMEFSKRFTTDEVWPAEMLDANPELSRQVAVRRSVPQRHCRQVPVKRNPSRVRQSRSEGLRLLRAEGPVRGIRRVRPGSRSRPRAVRHLPPRSRAALAGCRWQGDAVAVSRGSRPLRQARQERRLLRSARTGGRGSSPCPTSLRPNLPTPSLTSGW